MKCKCVITVVVFCIGMLSTCSLEAAETGVQVVLAATGAQKGSVDAHFNWVFSSEGDQALRTGQFACGTYWVAPAQGEHSIIFKSLTGNPKNTGKKKDRLSCDDDPVVEGHGLLSGKNGYGSYQASENLLTELPKTFTPSKGSCISLVAAKERLGGGGTKGITGEVVDAYCVVTLLAEVPVDNGNNMIRPNIVGTHKEFLTWDDFDLTRLTTHDFIPGTISAGEIETVRQRWSHSIEVFGGLPTQVQTKEGLKFKKFSEGGRAFRSHILVDDYSSGMAAAFNGDALSLLSSSVSIEQKKPYLAAMLAYGLDLYHGRYHIGDTAPKIWSSGAGQSMGSFLPPVLAAALLKDPSKANVLRAVAPLSFIGSGPLYATPQELRQIRRGQSGVLLWGDGHKSGNRLQEEIGPTDKRYWSDILTSRCYDNYVGKRKPDPNRGKKTTADQYGYIDGPANKPGTAYMGVTSGVFRGFAAVMILCPAVRSVVNSDAPIEYVDRLVRHGVWTWPDPVAIPSAAEQDTASVWKGVDGAPGWGKTWGPNLKDWRFAIEDGKGRFKSLHGEKRKKFYYGSGVAEQNWETIIQLYDGKRFEDYAVDLKTCVEPEIFFVPQDAEGKTARVIMWSPSINAKLHYSLGQEKPSESGLIFDPEVELLVQEGCTVNVMALHNSKAASQIATGTYAAPRMK